MSISVKTSRFGTLEVDEATIITMPRGPLGFEEQCRFVLLEAGKSGPFTWLQAVDDPELAFVLVDPSEFMADYQVRLTKEEFAELELGEGDEIVPLAVVNMGGDPERATANLQGPLVFNLRRRRARQVVLEVGRYHHRTPLFAASAAPA